ncbi:MAG: hypothetical protein GXP06_03495 [Alphaproteobacteria bacterium]|nr:hypothetical protein [Alphaproteobacteria bacterium]
MTFKQVSSWIALIAMTWVAVGYFLPLFKARSLDGGATAAIFGAMIMFVVIVVIGHVVVAIFAPKSADGEADERDKRIALYGERAGSYALGAFVLAGLALALIDGDMRMANLLFLGLVGSEIIKNGWQLALYRRDS